MGRSRGRKKVTLFAEDTVILHEHYSHRQLSENVKNGPDGNQRKNRVI